MIIIASDVSGYNIKNLVKFYLSEKYPNIILEDLGVYSNKNDVNCVRLSQAVALRVKEMNNDTIGIIISDKNEIVIAANRLKGIRCVQCNDIISAEKSRKDINANILSVKVNDSYDNKFLIIEKFINTKFDKKHYNIINILDDINDRYL